MCNERFGLPFTNCFHAKCGIVAALLQSDTAFFSLCKQKITGKTCLVSDYYVSLQTKVISLKKEVIMPTSVILDYDNNDKRAETMIELLLASGLFKKRVPSIDVALDDIAEGRIHHYNSLDELKSKFTNV